MIRVQTAEGTEMLTAEQYIERYGEEEYRAISKPPIPESEMTPGQKLLHARMQAPYLNEDGTPATLP